MTGLQLIGMVGVYWLFEDLVRWIQLPRVPPLRRSWQVRHALFGLAGPVCWGGMWMLFTLQESSNPGEPSLPWWLTMLAVVIGLALLAWVLLELRRTIWALHERS